MGVFTRFRDIISSNINAMLEKAENPEKLIKLMIQEMEDTLVEMKASCASSMANRSRHIKTLTTLKESVLEWEQRAKLAVDKMRDDLAREAIVQKRDLDRNLVLRQEEADHLEELIARHHKDIGQLEEKLATARAKYKVLLQREKLARERKKAQTTIRHAETSDAFTRFEHVEKRVDRIEAEAELVNAKRNVSLEDEFKRLEVDDEIEAELERIKAETSPAAAAPPPAQTSAQAS